MFSDIHSEMFTVRSAAFRRLRTSRETITGVNLINGQQVYRHRGLCEHEYVRIYPANVGTPGVDVSVCSRAETTLVDSHGRKTPHAM